MLALAVMAYGAYAICYERSQYAELLSPSLYVDVGRIMIVVSLISVVNSLIAIYSVMKELRCLIYSFATACFVIFVMLFIGGIMGLVFRHKLMHQIPLHLKMLTSLRELYNQRDMGELTTAWDSLQRNFRCCGVNGTDDYHVWRTSKWYMHYHPSAQRPLVPESCCMPGFVKECQNMTETINRDYVYEDTCYKFLYDDLLYVANVAAWLSIISSTVILLPALFAGVYARLIKK